jgi:hypothetical protein
VGLSDKQIREGVLSEIELFIVPGGPDAGESYYAKKGMDEITSFPKK